MANDLIVIFQVYLITLGIQMLAWPFLIGLKKTFVDSGWAVGRLSVTILVTTVIWFLAYLKIPINTEVGVFLVFFLLVIMSVWCLRRQKKVAVVGWFKKFKRLILIEEGLFLLGFVFLALMRGFNPDILDLEKFMDWGFVKAYLVSPTLPAKDMWWAGEAINYYSFGHFWASIMVRIFGVADGYGYNLMLAFICGLSLSVGFSVVVNLLNLTGAKKGLVLGGIVGASLLTFGGNSQMWWYILKNRSLEGYWYPDATRFIYHTIHEFPSYSFVVSDLHGHLLGLPIVLMFLLSLIVFVKRAELKTAIIIGFLLGVMMMTNTWDVLIYGLLLGVVIILKLKSNWKRLMVSGVVMLVVMIITAYWWWSGFKSISAGIGFVSERSPLWQLVALWGGHVIFAVGTFILAVRNKKSGMLPLSMSMVAIILLILPEIVYVRDIYTTYPRANTMFKLTYQSFVIMCLLAGWLISMLKQTKKRLRLLAWPLMLIWIGLLLYPIPAYPGYYGNLQTYRGLDGREWLKTVIPEQLAVINYLEENRDGKNLVEAVGESYTKYNAVSTFSGVPTIVGWKVHEWLWRGGFEKVGARADEVAKIYQMSDMEEVKEIIKKYNVGWIVVGENERASYKVDEISLSDLGERVFEFGGTYLIKIR